MVCPHCVLKDDRSLFSINLTSMLKKGSSAPLAQGQGHFKCIKFKGQITGNVFIEVTKVHMFFCPHCVLKDDRSIFSIILTTMWKRGCSAPWRRVRGILNALSQKARQQATWFLRSLRCTCFCLSALCP